MPAIEALQTLQREAESISRCAPGRRCGSSSHAMSRGVTTNCARSCVRSRRSSHGRSARLDHIPVESIAKLIRRALAGREPSPQLRQELLVLGTVRLEQRGPAESRRAAMILTDLGGARPDLAIGSGRRDRRRRRLGRGRDRSAHRTRRHARGLGAACSSTPARRRRQSRRRRWLARAGDADRRARRRRLPRPRANAARRARRPRVG